MQDAARVREDFDRIASLLGEQSDDGHANWLLRFVPRPCENALDVGCGTGSLARALSVRATRVLAVDLSPSMVRLARERSVRHPKIEFVVGDFLTMDLPAGTFDCIATVAALHHMPWARAIERAKELLRPGGTLLIVDLFQDEGLSDFLLTGVAWVLRLPQRLLRGGPRELRNAWAEHGRGDSYLTLSEVRRLCHRDLPGARVRRHLFWRYSVVWTKAA